MHAVLRFAYAAPSSPPADSSRPMPNTPSQHADL
jgi:hypothetical protein